MEFITAKFLAFLFFLFSFLPQSTYREGLVGQPIHLNPLRTNSNSVDETLSRLIFNSLMKYNRREELTTDLAQKYEISADQREYRFYLRQGVFWHDGVEFNADDVIYTASQHPQLKLLQVDRLDRYGVKFTLKSAYAAFLDLLALTPIIPAHLENRSSDSNPIGTGEFRLARVNRSDKIDEAILLRASRNPEKANFNRVIFRFYNRPEDLLLAARLGEIDGFAAEGVVDRLANFRQYRAVVGGRHYGLFFNLSHNSDLKDRELRRDIAVSIPKERIIDEVFKGFAVPANSPIEDTFATSAALVRLDFRPDLAKKYDLNFTLTVPKKEINLEVSEIIKSSLERVGIHLKIRPVLPERIVSEVIANKDFDLLLLGQEIERDPDVYTLWHSTQKNLPGLNFTGFESVLADKALEEGRKTIIHEERLRHYQNFQKIFLEEIPAVLIYHPVLTYTLRSTITGVDLTGLFKIEDRFMSINNWSL